MSSLSSSLINDGIINTYINNSSCNIALGIKLSGKGFNDPINNDNNYDCNGIGLQLIRNNSNIRELGIIDTNNLNKIQFSINKSNINFNTTDSNNNSLPLIINSNIFLNNSNIGININNPMNYLHLHYPLEEKQELSEIGIQITDVITGSNSNNGILLKKDSNQNFLITNNFSNANIILGTASNSSALFITSNGSIGFGTNKPLQYLDITGNTLFRSNISVNGSIFRPNGTPYVSSHWSNSSITPSTIFYNTGGVGIGTTSILVPTIDNATDISLSVINGITCRKIYIDNQRVDSTFITRTGKNASEIDTGILKIAFGGTGLNFFNPDEVLFGGTIGVNNALKQSPNFKYIENTASLIITGNIGINTGNPRNILDVNGTVFASAYSTPSGSVNFLSGPAQRNRMVITSEGLVGIGTILPQSFIHIYNPSITDTRIQITNDTSGTGINNGFIVGKSPNNESYITNLENANLRLGTNKTDNLIITPNGSVGININNPQSMLHINNTSIANTRIQITDFNSGNTTNDGFIIGKDTNNESYITNLENTSLRFGTNAIDRMIITSNGFIGIGISNPRSTVHINNSNSSILRFQLTDSNSGSNINNGLVLAKDINNDCYLTNYQNANLRLGTNGNDQMIINSNGFIGIGITNAKSLLQLNSSVSSDVRIQITDINSGFESSNGFIMGKGINNQAYITNLQNASLRLGTNGTDKMTITSAGFVGIGIASPQSLLQLNNSSGGDVRIQLTDTNSGSSINDGIILRKSTNNELYLTNLENANLRLGTNGLDRLIVSPTGFVGIGIDVPKSMLHIHSPLGGDTRIQITDPSNSGINTGDGVVLGKTSDNQGYFTNLENAGLRFGTNSIDRMFITSNGFIGIGTQYPKQALHIYHANNSLIRIENNNDNINQTSGIEFGIPSYSSATRSKITSTSLINNANTLEFYTAMSLNNSTLRLMISSNGNIGIGTNNPQSILHLNNNSSNNSNDVRIHITDIKSGFNSSNGVIIGKDAISNKAYFINQNNANLTLGTNGIEYLIINSNGNINIGNSNTSNQNLNILGDVTVTGKITFTSIISSNGDELGSQWENQRNVSNIYYNYGNVGIGTNSPDEKLSIIGNSKVTGNLIISPPIVNCNNLPITISYKNQQFNFNSLGININNNQIINAYNTITTTSSLNTSFNFRENSNYGYYLLNSNASITFANLTDGDIIIAGAGGTGGIGSFSSGGGAGELIYYPNFKFQKGTYSINIGIGNTTNMNHRTTSINFSNNTIIYARGGGDGASFSNNFIQFPTIGGGGGGGISSNISNFDTSVLNFPFIAPSNLVNINTNIFSKPITNSTSNFIFTNDGAIIITSNNYPSITTNTNLNNNNYFWYQFNNSTTIGLDSGGANLNMNNVGNNIILSSDAIKGNRSGVFNGSNAYLLTNANFNLNDTDWSIALWIKRSDNNRAESLFSFGNNPIEDGSNLDIGYTIENNLQINFTGIGNNYITPEIYGSDAGVWTHLAFTFKNSTGNRKIYRNGLLVGDSGASSIKLFGGTLMTIGSKVNTNFYKGLINDFRLYKDIELTQSQISELFNSTIIRSYPILTNINPIAWYKFNNPINIGIDSSSNNYNSSNLASSVVQYNTNIITKENSSAYFNGNNNSWLSGLNFNLNNTSFTISVWIRLGSINNDSISANKIILGYSTGNNITRGSLNIGFNQNSSVFFDFMNDNLTYPQINTNDLNIWNHWCFVYNINGNIRQIYKNGNLVANGITSGSLNASGGTYRIGYRFSSDSTNTIFKGYMNDFRIYNIPLSLTQIQELYKGIVNVFGYIPSNTNYNGFIGSNIIIDSLLSSKNNYEFLGVSSNTIEFNYSTILSNITSNSTSNFIFTSDSAIIVTSNNYQTLANISSNINISNYLWYPFDNFHTINYGLDNSGNNSNLNIIGNLNSSTDTIKGNLSLSFNGINTYLERENLFNLANSDWSISVWCKKTFNNREDIILSYGDLYIGYNDTNNLTVNFPNFIFNTSRSFNDAGIWTHLVFTFNNLTKNRSIYRNGTLIQTVNDQNSLTENNFLRVGAKVINNSIISYYSGLLSDLRIFKEISLNQSEITQLFNSYIDRSYGSVLTPIAWYKFDDNLNIGKDSIDSYNLLNSSPIVEFNTNNYIKGVGSALFNGTFLYNFTGNLRNQSYSICLWAYSTDISGNKGWFFGPNSGSSTYPIYGIVFSQNLYQIQANTGNGTLNYVFPEGINIINKWVHICFTYNSTTKRMNIYRDGQLGSFGTMTNDITFNYSSLAIGRVWNNSIYDFIGQLDDFRVYDFDLSPTQVQEIYQGRVRLFNYNYYTPTINTGNPSSNFALIPSIPTNGIIGISGGSGGGFNYNEIITGSNLIIGESGNGIGSNLSSILNKTSPGSGGNAGFGQTGTNGIVILKIPLDAGQKCDLNINGTIISPKITNNDGDIQIINNTNIRFITGNNNQDRLLISSNGNIGIGKSNPLYTLDINGSIFASNLIINEMNISNDIKTNLSLLNNYILSNNTSNSNNYNYLNNYNNLLNQPFYNSGSNIYSLSNFRIGIGISNSTSPFQIGNGGRLSISSNDIDRTIIGTNDINNLSNTCIILNGRTRPNINGSIEYNSINSGNHIWNTNDNVTITERMRLTNNGILALNITNPNANGRLQVRGKVNFHAGNPFAIVNNYMQDGSLTIGDQNLNYGGGVNYNTNIAGLLLECADNTEIAVNDTGSRISSLIYFSGGGNYYHEYGRNMGWGNPNQHYFRCNSMFQVFLNNGFTGFQNFTIEPLSLWGDGTTTASETAGTRYATIRQIALQNPRIVSQTVGSKATIQMGRAGGISTGNFWELACRTDGKFHITNNGNDTTNGMFINIDGKVGINNISPPYHLYVVGDIAATGNVINNFSDIRLKNIESNIEKPLEIIDKLKGFYYYPNEIGISYGMKNKKQIGLSAQDVNEVIPEIVEKAPFDTIIDEFNNLKSKSGNDYLTISYERLIPVLIEAIKELNNKNKKLEIEINEIKGNQ